MFGVHRCAVACALPLTVTLCIAYSDCRKVSSISAILFPCMTHSASTIISDGTFAFLCANQPVFVAKNFARFLCHSIYSVAVDGGKLSHLYWYTNKQWQHEPFVFSSVCIHIHSFINPWDQLCYFCVCVCGKINFSISRPCHLTYRKALWTFSMHLQCCIRNTVQLMPGGVELYDCSHLCKYVQVSYTANRPNGSNASTSGEHTKKYAIGIFFPTLDGVFFSLACLLLLFTFGI